MAAERQYKAKIIAAVDTLNKALKTLPDWLDCSLEDLFIDFEVPECSPEVYLVMLEEEINKVRARINLTDQAESDTRIPLLLLHVMLLECALAIVLALADVEPELLPPPGLNGRQLN